jgi:hypothetical protein
MESPELFAIAAILVSAIGWAVLTGEARQGNGPRSRKHGKAPSDGRSCGPRNPTCHNGRDPGDPPCGEF